MATPNVTPFPGAGAPGASPARRRYFDIISAVDRLDTFLDSGDFDDVECTSPDAEQQTVNDLAGTAAAINLALALLCRACKREAARAKGGAA
jgi:hypothetical protein